jgi:catechol 2,3-dioxygenase-like lactoylglutathione lyase family enzyme
MAEVDRLLAAYERGRLTRRQYLYALAALLAGTPAAGGQASATPLGRRARNINHVSVGVSDLKRAAAFYQKLGVSGELRPIIPPKPGTGEVRYGIDIADGVTISLGDTTDKNQLGKISHFCIGIEGFDYKRDMAALRAAGLEVRESSNSFFLRDPDGNSVQVSDAREMWRCPNGPARPPC